MSVRAKFIVQSVIHQTHDSSTGSVVLRPVFGTSDPLSENSKFWNATPSGEIRMDITTKNALDQFKAGQEFYVTFEPATIREVLHG